MPKPFDYSKSIVQTKEYMEDCSGFVPFLMAKLFSSHPDYVHIANMVNKTGSHLLSKRAVYDLYFYTIPQSKRWLKYPKKEAEFQRTKYIMEYFGVDESEARTYLEILPKEVVKEIVDIFQRRSNNGKERQ